MRADILTQLSIPFLVGKNLYHTPRTVEQPPSAAGQPCATRGQTAALTRG
eukprot:CAMPEP_0194768970 /NCGR_PEP_ID=MMETSP0323_2-20130528/41401_1 /TAXON_ID=2866 ORGANISM="Crypthecodinium cohnii, Strain Seligo" /NCGR_SAMPLE_ID=MMETSP0323_2 /ASSEMBLY_ACC=CAM_ASM_000346 /LENGTH=49 /DNA_ID= /DNA_START= /DNA_END= /DNA_ORIENTATION=